MLRRDGVSLARLYRLHSWCIALALCCCASALMAASFPSKPIRLIVGFEVGTGSDLLARIVADKLGAQLGVPVVVENRPGAGGVIATLAAARAAPDGYTLVIGTTSTLITNPALNPYASYRVDKDFAPITSLASTTMVLVAPTGPAGARNIDELVESVRAGKPRFSSAGEGTIGHLTSEMFARRLGVQAEHVPYKGSGASLTSVLRGDAQFASDSLPATLPLIRAGQLTPLAVTNPQRLTVLPNVPTFAEAGLQDLSFIVWWGLCAPTGTPEPIIEQLAAAAHAAERSADVVQRLRELLFEPFLLSPREFGEFIERERAFWEPWARAIKTPGTR